MLFHNFVFEYLIICADVHITFLYNIWITFFNELVSDNPTRKQVYHTSSIQIVAITLQPYTFKTKEIKIITYQKQFKFINMVPQAKSYNRTSH